ncbi:hypothetical protein CEXT_365171 [Caerostris extrusa]|uniref:Uncharacterized protein n=1 Tax=Caerostris extrusa TaxID=172846 RepID=A0AAV4VC20_CAEEX|nr:hypothetical protein CEXT_365171 [Caerostris extrusa]
MTQDSLPLSVIGIDISHLTSGRRMAEALPSGICLHQGAPEDDALINVTNCYRSSDEWSPNGRSLASGIRLHQGAPETDALINVTVNAPG